MERHGGMSLKDVADAILEEWYSAGPPKPYVRRDEITADGLVVQVIEVALEDED